MLKQWCSPFILPWVTFHFHGIWTSAAPFWWTKSRSCCVRVSTEMEASKILVSSGSN
jgi:hypothetical protein